MFEQFLTDAIKELSNEFTDTNSYKDNIVELDDKFLVEIELPGFKKSDLDISTKMDSITVEAKYKTENFKNSNKIKYIRRTRDKSDFSKKYIVGEGIDTNSITANFENGLLTIELPKGGELKTRKVNIN